VKEVDFELRSAGGSDTLLEDVSSKELDDSVTEVLEGLRRGSYERRRRLVKQRDRRQRGTE